MPIAFDDITTVSIVGAGQMGRGIGAVAALSGYDVYVTDVDESQLEDAKEHIEWSYDKTVEKGRATNQEVTAALERISFTADFEAAIENTDFVTEAVVEKQSVKEEIFQDLDTVAPADAILATNTSGLNITRIADVTDRPRQVIGTHWFKPPMLMDLVEVVMTEYTRPETAETVETLIDSFGKTSIRCRKDIPSFIINRLMRPYSEEPGWMVYRGEHSIAEIDSAMKFKEGFPMGPFELADFTGGIKNRVESATDLIEDTRPMSYDTDRNPLLYQLYDKGRFGRKTGAGFYEYADQDEPNIPVDTGQGFDTLLVWAPIINEAAKLIENDVATASDIDTGAKLASNWPQGPLEKADEIGAGIVVQKLAEVASRHTDTNKLIETLPCDLLIDMAKTGATFHS